MVPPCRLEERWKWAGPYRIAAVAAARPLPELVVGLWIQNTWNP